MPIRKFLKGFLDQIRSEMRKSLPVLATSDELRGAVRKNILDAESEEIQNYPPLNRTTNSGLLTEQRLGPRL